MPITLRRKLLSQENDTASRMREENHARSDRDEQVFSSGVGAHAFWVLNFPFFSFFLLSKVTYLGGKYTLSPPGQAGRS